MTQPASPTVLLIEESATLRYALEKQLRANHYQVQVADTYNRRVQVFEFLQ